MPKPVFYMGGSVCWNFFANCLTNTSNTFIKNSDFNLELEDFYRMKFDYAIEDSPLAFKFFEHLPDLQVLLIDRPWNWECELPNSNYTRCAGWDRIRELVGIK